MPRIFLEGFPPSGIRDLEGLIDAVLGYLKFVFCIKFKFL